MHHPAYIAVQFANQSKVDLLYIALGYHKKGRWSNEKNVKNVGSLSQKCVSTCTVPHTQLEGEKHFAMV
jgi:hypothetical protein